jgi:hypothetical protein
MASRKGSATHRCVVWALVIAVALVAGPSTVAWEDEDEGGEPDEDDMCQYLDPEIWGDACGSGAGDGGSGGPPTNCDECRAQCKKGYDDRVEACGLTGPGGRGLR